MASFSTSQIECTIRSLQEERALGPEGWPVPASVRLGPLEAPGLRRGEADVHRTDPIVLRGGPGGGRTIGRRRIVGGHEAKEVDARRRPDSIRTRRQDSGRFMSGGPVAVPERTSSTEASSEEEAEGGAS